MGERYVSERSRYPTYPSNRAMGGLNLTNGGGCSTDSRIGLSVSRPIGLNSVFVRCRHWVFISLAQREVACSPSDELFRGRPVARSCLKSALIYERGKRTKVIEVGWGDRRLPVVTGEGSART